MNNQNGGAPEFSVVIPMKNEADNVLFLLDGISAACDGRRFEVILVDDGSDDDTLAIIRRAQADRPWLRAVKHDVSGGQSAAVHSGVTLAHGPVICTLDGDGQNPPAEIPHLLAAIEGAASVGLVAGQRVARQDTWSKKIASKLANAIRGYILKDRTRDTGCGLKAFRRDAFLELPYFNNMHRYLPALFSAHGWDVAHVDVSHTARHAGRSNYNNLQRGLVGIRDLIGVSWLIARRKKSRPTEVPAK
ncbi:glycosyltransferase family 2 protein [Actibacterium sp. D379-3]